jgi:DNA-binding winged helix-turn-helix (wHTH) protein
VDYYFNNFQFNGLSLLLMKDGQPLSIRNNEAKLLAFFLANPNQVFSKDAILENVWAGKVVSEQAVFQAISNLRALFGDEAIKTFSKKGYQWQLPLHNEPAPVAPQKTAIHPPTVNTVRAYKFWLNTLVALIVIGVSLAFYFNLVSTDLAAVTHKPIRIIVEPFTLDANNTGAEDIIETLHDAMQTQFSKNPEIAIDAPPSEHSSYQLAATPSHFFNVYKQAVDVNLLVTGRVRQTDDSWTLAFVFQGQGDYNQWRGYLTATSAAALAMELETLLSKIAPMKILWESQDLRLLNAQLQLLYSETPGNLPILYQLVDNLLYMGDLDSARLRALELFQHASAAADLRYQSLALRAQAAASMDLVDADQVIAMLDKSAALAATANDPFLQSHAMEHYAPIYYRLKNFELMEKNLLDALVLAEAARAPDQQAKILRMLSIFSYKFQRPDKRDIYLVQAQSILDQYEFPGESYALLEDIAGMFTDDDLKKEQFFWRALNRFTPQQEAWIKERAQEHLVDLYIDQERWEDAFAVLAKETNFSGAEFLFLAKIHFSQKNFALAQTQAEAAFKQARLSGEYYAALDAALLLAQLHKQFNQVGRQKDRIEYINKNAPPFWKASKQIVLEELADDPMGY